MKKIIHIDMDAFYAAVEQRDNAALRGKAVVVGGKPNSRGVVCAASYEARRFGIRSAMPCGKAAQLCPHAIFIPPRFPAYKDASRRLREIFAHYTDMIEPLSLDEAYLDVTVNKIDNPSATRIAEAIRARIYDELHLTASAGVATAKFIAKIASDVNKPNGLCVVQPGTEQSFLAPLPIRKIPGIGAVSAKRCANFGIHTIGDILLISEQDLNQCFGRFADRYRNMALGRHNGQVRTHRERKSLGIEHTFGTDVKDMNHMYDELHKLAEKLWERYHGRSLQARGISLKVKYPDFRVRTRSTRLPHDWSGPETIFSLCPNLLAQTDALSYGVRLLGLSLHDFVKPSKHPQLRLDLNYKS